VVHSFGTEMAILVPFDGSAHARLGLARGGDLAGRYDVPLLAVAVVHKGVDNPVELGWQEPGERFDPDTAANRLSRAVREIAPRADFRALQENARLPHGAVAKRIRRLARREGVDLVVMGSENAGRIFTPLSSVGGGVATDRRYDVFLVRREESALFGRSKADR
jgi:nucleotide-binding universal stress UspA family protein